MNKTVKTTRIEKHYTDRKTGEKKSITINYAKVVDRLNEFRSENPRGKIETTYQIADGFIAFKTYILKDKSDINSAEATGHAVAKNDGGEKQFEKLETLSVGRALAMLGYAASGEIASFEEMEDYNAYKDEKIEEAIGRMKSSENLEELKTIFMSLGSLMANSRIIEAKDAKKASLNENNK
jgi:hypothetical protein